MGTPPQPARSFLINSKRWQRSQQKPLLFSSIPILPAPSIHHGGPDMDPPSCTRPHL